VIKKFAIGELTSIFLELTDRESVCRRTAQ